MYTYTIPIPVCFKASKIADFRYSNGETSPGCCVCPRQHITTGHHQKPVHQKLPVLGIATRVLRRAHTGERKTTHVQPSSKYGDSTVVEGVGPRHNKGENNALLIHHIILIPPFHPAKKERKRRSRTTIEKRPGYSGADVGQLTSLRVTTVGRVRASPDCALIWPLPNFQHRQGEKEQT